MATLARLVTMVESRAAFAARALPAATLVVGLALGLALEFAFATPALACPDCASARSVDVAVYDERFFATLVLVAMPLLVLAPTILFVPPRDEHTPEHEHAPCIFGTWLPKC